MVLVIFGTTVELIRSTSPVTGKLCASIREPSGNIVPDVFLWDPLNSSIEYADDQLNAYLARLRTSQSSAIAAALWLTDGLIELTRGVKKVFGGSYGGSLGFGGMGGIVAILSAVLFIFVSIAAAVIVVPLSLAAWALRVKFNADIAAERVRLLSLAGEYFESLQANRTASSEG